GLRVEPTEGGAEVVPLAQDREPGEPGLEGLEGQPLEDARVAAHRLPPLLVVVGEVVRGSQCPGAAQHAIGPGYGSAGDAHFCGSHRARSSSSSRRNVAISTSRAVTDRAITPRASSVADTLYPHSASGGRSRATSAAGSSSRRSGAKSLGNAAISPARPRAASTTQARIATAASTRITGTIRIVPCSADDRAQTAPPGAGRRDATGAGHPRRGRCLTH